MTQRDIPATVPSFGFTGPLRVERYARNKWLTCARLCYLDKAGKLHVVPEGFLTDFASVPRLAQWLIDDDDFAPAAVLHDWFYASHIVTKREADALFREALRSLGCGWLSSWIQWRAVHRLGFIAWNSRREKLIEDLVKKHSEENK